LQIPPGLREVNVNVLGISRKSMPEVGDASLSAFVCAGNIVPLVGRGLREPSSRKIIKKPIVVALEGGENAMPSQAQAPSRSIELRRSHRVAK